MLSQSQVAQLPRWPQRQDSLTDQLRDLVIVANILGMHDAADFLRHNHVNSKDIDDGR